MLIIADEAYKEIIYDGIKYSSIISFDDMKERTVLINSFSKTYSMTGWRIGYAAVEALSGSQEYTGYMIGQFEKRRNILVDGINNIKGMKCIKPQGTFYAFANIKALGMSSMDFAFDLLDKVQVALVPGITYGRSGEGYVRMAFTVDEEKLKETVRRIRHYVEIM